MTLEIHFKKYLCLECFCSVVNEDYLDFYCRSGHLNTCFTEMLRLFFLNQSADIYHQRHTKKLYLNCKEQILRALCKEGAYGSSFPPTMKFYFVEHQGKSVLTSKRNGLSITMNNWKVFLKLASKWSSIKFCLFIFSTL